MSASSSNFPARLQQTSVSLDAAAPIVFLGRLLFALIFLMSGPMHFSSQTIAYAASQGVPLASIVVPISGVLAIVGGLSILLGYRAKLGAWRRDFNEVRPHSSLAYLTPAAYARALCAEAGRRAANPDHSARRPLASGDHEGSDQLRTLVMAG